MMPTICRQCGGPIFYNAREGENPNICHACGACNVECDTSSENVICLLPYFEADRRGSGPIDEPAPDAEEADRRLTHP